LLKTEKWEHPGTGVVYYAVETTSEPGRGGKVTENCWLST